MLEAPDWLGVVVRKIKMSRQANKRTKQLAENRKPELKVEVVGDCDGVSDVHRLSTWRVSGR